MSLQEIKSLIEDQGAAWVRWKEKNEAKYDELYKEVEQLAIKANRPGFAAGNSGSNTIENKALENGFKALIAGQQEKANQFFVEAKALSMSFGSSPDGGFLSHTTISTEMIRVMAEISPIYRLARKVQIPESASFEEIIDRSNIETVWVAEFDSRYTTTPPTLGTLTIALHEIYAKPEVSQKLIDTASIDIVKWLTGKIADAFATAEAAAFHTGNGCGKPQGILAYPTAATADASRAWGTVQHIPTGTSGAFNATTKGDCLIDTVASLKNQYRAGSVWIMNRKTAATIRKIKESTTDAYIWAPGLQAGQPEMLLGFPIVLDENMADISSDSYSIAFGNLQRAYTIVEHPGIKMLADPYSSKPKVQLYGYRRVGGALSNTEALKLVKFSAS